MLEVSEPVVETLAANSMKRQEANKVAAKPVESQKKFNEEGFVEDFQKGDPKKFNDNLPKLSQSKLLERDQKILEKVAEPVTVAVKSMKRQERTAFKDDTQRKIKPGIDKKDAKARKAAKSETSKKEKQVEKAPLAEDFDKEGFGEDFQKGEPKKFNTDLPKLSRHDKKKFKKEQAAKKSAASKMEGSGASACEEAFSLSPVQQFAKSGGNDIKIDSFSLKAGSLEILSNTSLLITMGRRYGLVGRNGAGKTTLLRHIAEKKLQIPPHIDVLLCEQEVVADEKTPVQIILNADTERCKIIDKRKKLETYQEKYGENIEKIQNKIIEIDSQWQAIGADSAESKARRILSGLGFDSEMQNKASKDLSGGWRMRISLARALYLEPTLLLLDEPTNQLDFKAYFWLDNFLQAWKKTLLVVSHDQSILDNVCTDIIHLCADQKHLKYYKGNYSQYKNMAQQQRKKLEKEYEKQQKKLKEMKAQGKSKKQAELRQKEVGLRTRKQEKNKLRPTEEDAKAPELLQKIKKNYAVSFSFPATSDLRSPVLEIDQVTFGWVPERPLFEEIDLSLGMKSRVAIMGLNGVGKSTFLKILTGEETPQKGKVTRYSRLKIGKFSQHSEEHLPADESPTGYLLRRFGALLDGKPQNARKALGTMGLSPHAHYIKIRDLSGGQKARVVLTELFLTAPDLLILDEPTNNLDIESINALKDAFMDYKGGVVMVTHNNHLIEDYTLYVMENQTIKKIEGNFHDFKKKVIEEIG
ncbi:ATP-binding cassette sub-family F member 1-like [Artemia franciscana]